MINQLDDEISQLATNFIPNELLFFKRIVKKKKKFLIFWFWKLAEIVQSDEESKSFMSVDALNERGKINAEEAEALIQRFVKENWLEINNHK